MKTLSLIAILALAWWGYRAWQGPTINVPAYGGSNIKINADSILRIAELAGATQEVTVFFDTTYTRQQADIKIFGIVLAERQVIERYSESRTWKFKAGIDAVRITRDADGVTVHLGQPKILSAEELTERFVVLAHTGDNWNPASTHLHMQRSRALAQATAMRSSILQRAAINVADVISNLIPQQNKIKWETPTIATSH